MDWGRAVLRKEEKLYKALAKRFAVRNRTVNTSLIGRAAVWSEGDRLGNQLSVVHSHICARFPSGLQGEVRRTGPAGFPGRSQRKDIRYVNQHPGVHENKKI